MIGMPSLAVMDRSTEARIWLATAPADMRCGFDRLAELAQVVTSQNPMDGHLFLFRGRSGDRLKILYFDRDGYALWYKRLEEGVFKLPRPPVIVPGTDGAVGGSLPRSSTEPTAPSGSVNGN